MKEELLKEVGKYPISKRLLSGYVSSMTEEDIQRDEIHHYSIVRLLLKDPNKIRRFEDLFERTLRVLCMTSDELLAASEFNFRSYDPFGFEAFVCVLRGIIALSEQGYRNIRLINKPGLSDLLCEKDGKKFAAEVKAILYKHGESGDSQKFLEDRLHDKLTNSSNLPKARKQLREAKKRFGCDRTIYMGVINRQDLFLFFGEHDWLAVTNRLESGTPHLNHLECIDLVFFVTGMGGQHVFEHHPSNRPGEASS